MGSPFFNNYWKQPSESRSVYGGFPVKRKAETPSPKVISIPVHFVDSGKKLSDSALKIQKVFRGFLLRKSVNKIVCIRNEVHETERRINESVELIRKDQKERLRINETLMASLLKLDSIRGIDSGIRDFRRGVIKKAIALQEKVDALVSDTDKSSSGGEMLNDPISDEMTIENCGIKSEMDQSEGDEEVDCVVKEIVEEHNTMNCVGESEMQEEMIDCSKGVEVKEENPETGVMEIMREDNEKMMRMMSELVEKNELQTRMLKSLTHRITQLEKAYLCDKLRTSSKKKKQKQNQRAEGKQL